MGKLYVWKMNKIEDDVCVCMGLFILNLEGSKLEVEVENEDVCGRLVKRIE